MMQIIAITLSIIVYSALTIFILAFIKDEADGILFIILMLFYLVLTIYAIVQGGLNV